MAYLEALSAAPDLVKRETPFERFLAVEDGNSLAASRRLCSYWTERKDIFGERALLPMSQADGGALTGRDT